MSVFVITPSKLCGRVVAPYSKSHLLRLSALAAFSDAPTNISGYSDCRDVNDFLSFLGAFASIQRTATGILITPCGQAFDKAVYRGEGALGRSLSSALCSVLGTRLFTLPLGRLAKRSNPLRDCLLQNGIAFNNDSQSGVLSGSSFCPDCSQSSQPLSALLTALPLLNRQSIIKPCGLVSKGYVQLTLHCLRLFGAPVTVTGNEYYVNGLGRFCSPGMAVALRDASAAAVLTAAGVLCGEVCITADTQTSQPDMCLPKLLHDLGLDVEISDKLITAKKSEIKPFITDANEMPDAVPVAAVLAAMAKGESKIVNVQRLTQKESDRLAGTVNLLKAFGVEVGYSEGTISVSGGKPLHGARLRLNDHRLEFAATLLALCADSESVITAEGYSKSYPDFFRDMRSLGAVINEIQG